MVEQLTLLARVVDVLAGKGAVPPGFTFRPVSPGDSEDLGRLYFESYPPGVASSTLDEAHDDILASFAGDYGPFWFEASPVAVSGSSIVAAIMTVREAPWPDAPRCPFVIELFTEPPHRGVGLARQLLRTACAVIERDGGSEVALRVAADNTPALRLYERAGFRPV